MLRRRTRILLVYLHAASFVQEDAAHLSRWADVRTFLVPGSDGKAASLLAGQLRFFFWLLRELPRADCVFGWFVDYHLFLPTLLARAIGKPVVAVVGGMDANHLPEYGYGVFDSPWRAALARFIYPRLALLLPVAEALMFAETAFGAEGVQADGVRANGVRAHLPALRVPYRVLPTGYDADFWTASDAPRERAVLTVAFIGSMRTAKIKGVDLLVEAARQLQGVQFSVAGVDPAFEPQLRAALRPPENVLFLPPRPREALRDLYRRASVYAQLSRTEGLPNVLCEAMLCGCVPVGSRVGGIPEAIGGAGLIVERADAHEIADAIKTALQSDGQSARRAARERIAGRFTNSARSLELEAALKRLITSAEAKP